MVPTTPDPNDQKHEQSEAWTHDPSVGRPYGYHRPLPESPNGRDPLKGSPWWVRATAVIGLPAAFGAAAFFGFWAAFQVMSAAPQENKTMLTEMRQADRQHDETGRDSFSALRQQGEVQIQLLRNICESVAKTDLQRSHCRR